MTEEDPRTDPPSLAEVPELVRAGASEYGEGRFWHAHEDWEEAWHALRAADRASDAAFLQGMILVTAAFENVTRGKPAGFRRQMAQGLHQMRSNPGAGVRLGLADPEGWIDALVDVYLDACRRRDPERWREGPWSAPPLEIEP